MRKGFNFYRSYYDVAKELPEKDRLLFLWAIIQKQFDGTEPDLKGQSNFAYISQKHSIDAQVLGYETKTKTKLAPTLPPCQPPVIPPSVQGKEKGKEKEELIVIPTEVEFLNFCKDIKEFNYLELEYSYKSKYQTWVSDGWKDGNGNVIKNWKGKIRNTAPFLKPIKQNNTPTRLQGTI